MRGGGVGRDRARARRWDQCDAWGAARGGVCRLVKMWNFSEAHAAGVCMQMCVGSW